MKYTVFMLREAEYDLETIFEYFLGTGNIGAAKNLIKRIRKACESLSHMPERGHFPPELARIENFEYREIIVKSYRIVYQVIESNVFIFGIIHGKRNVDDVLKKRLFLAQPWMVENEKAFDRF